MMSKSQTSKRQYNKKVKTYQTLNAHVSFVLSQFITSKWQLQPAYQRQRDLWPTIRKNDLLKTVFDRMPIPSLYLYDEDENVSLFDGLQRVSTLLSFYQNTFAVPIDIFENKELVMDQKKKKIFYSDLTKEGQHVFESCCMTYILLKDIRNPDEYFRHLNYVLPQTFGERLHSINNNVTQKIEEIITQNTQTQILSRKSEDRRFKIFEKLTICLFLKTCEHVPTSQNNLLDFARTTSLNSIDINIWNLIDTTLKSHPIIFDNHLIPLLNCTNPLTSNYDAFANLQLLPQFDTLLSGNGKSLSSIEKNIVIFNALVELRDVKLEENLLRSEIIKGQKMRYPKHLLTHVKLLDFIAKQYETVTKSDVSLSKNCQLCETFTVTGRLGYDGGFWNRCPIPISVCFDCNKKLSLFDSNEFCK